MHTKPPKLAKPPKLEANKLIRSGKLTRVWSWVLRVRGLVPRFAFEAINSAGSVVRGSLDASSSGSALEQLLAVGQTPVSINEISIERGAASRTLERLAGRAFQMPVFLRELGILLKAGLPVERALIMLESVAPNSRHAMRVQQMLTRIRYGEPLSQAFANVVKEAPPYVSRLLAAGEASGMLADVVSRQASVLDRARALREKLYTGLSYPLVLVVAMVAVLGIVFTVVLPRLTPMFEDAGAALPMATSILLSLEKFLNAYGWLLLLALAIMILFLVTAWRRSSTRLTIDRFLFLSPLFLDLPRRYASAQFCRTLEMLLAGGLSLERALATAREASPNSWFRQQLIEGQRAIAEGVRLRQAFGRLRAIPPLVTEFAAVGEETGQLSTMMGEAASALDQEVETRLNRLTALVVPLATLLIGALVSMIMAGVVSGMLAVNDLAR